MSSNKVLAFHGLKWNPYSPGVPVEALHVTPHMETFCWQVEQLVNEGGFALVTGAPGVGKSSALRILSDRLAAQRDVQVGLLSRPHARVADFYREAGFLYGVALQPHNRWNGAKLLRERWLAHMKSALSRPVLIIDEAQEMMPAVLSELRLLISAQLDSQILLTVVLAGDNRLADRLKSEEFLPLDSRIRVRLSLRPATHEELRECLLQVTRKSGAIDLISEELIPILCDRANGNLRSLMIMANSLLSLAAQTNARRIDEKLYFEMTAQETDTKTAGKRRR